MKMNRLHWVAFGLTVALMFVWQGTALGVHGRTTFERWFGDGGWAWPVCGLAAFWATYGCLKLGAGLWSRRRQARLGDL